MSLPTTYSLIFFIAVVIYFFFGIYILSLNAKSGMHRVFFYSCLTLCIWAFSFSISNSAPDMEMSLFWRRVGALGWGSFFSFTLNFILILTEKNDLLKKKWIYFLIYFPAVLNIFVFSLCDSIAIKQYDLLRISTGWVNINETTLWDKGYQLYYGSFALLCIGLLWQWGASSKERVKKKQAYLLIASYVLAILLGTLTEYIINFYFSFKIPQLGPVFVLFPVSAMFFCVTKYGLLVEKRKKRVVETGQILNEANRMKLYWVLTQGYILGAFLNFALQYFFNREPLASVLLFSAIILLIGLVLQIIQNLNIKIAIKDALLCLIMTASIPLMILKYMDHAGFYALSVPIIFVMASVAFNQRRFLISVGAATLFTLIAVWIIAPAATITIEPLDHLSRLVIFAIFIGIAFYINRIYLQRLKENEKQVETQKLLSQVSTNFVTANENNMDVKINELITLLGEFFKADRTRLYFFSNGRITKNLIYEWCNVGVESTMDSFSDVSITELPYWMDFNKWAQNGGICIPEVAALPEGSSEKEWLRTNQIKSLIVIPLMDKEKMIGLLIFDAIRSGKRWFSDDQELLRAIANRISDIWLKVEAEKKINYLAYYDVLTGLPNRALFNERMKQAIGLAARTEKLIIVAFIDIDNLKTINDTMGHDGGDDFLIQITKRLSACVRQYDTVARFEGDEFLIIIPQISLLEDVPKVANKIMEVFHTPLIIKNQEFFVTASMGVAIFPIDGETTEELIKNADLAMNTSKLQGKNRFYLCSADMKKEFQKHMELSNSLYRALDRNELMLFYQPQIFTATGEIIGVEALIRWRHPQKGMISPGEFIPIAEKNGLINTIGLWVLQTACRQNKAWQDQGLRPIRMAVNLSLGQFLNNKLVGIVSGILQETGLDPAYLELEITESIAINEPENIIRTLNDLKALGVSISIDDFGTEYSSLSRLKTLPIDRVKIDIQFIRGISKGSKEEGIIKVIMQLARTLDLKVTAEGVETEQQLAFLREILCDEIQGFYYYRPMPVNEMGEVLSSITRSSNG